MEQNVLLSLSHISKRFKTEQALKDIDRKSTRLNSSHRR